MFKNLNNLEKSKIIFKINNDLNSRKFSTSKKKFTYKSHLIWFKKKLKDKRFKVYLYYNKKKVVGSIRSESRNGYKNLSWGLLKKYRGKNLGKEMLKKFVDKYGKKFKAKVHKENIASLRICEIVGFKIYRKYKKFYYYKYLN